MQCCPPGFGFCSHVQIALKDFQFLALNPALHPGIILQNPSFFLGNKTKMGVDYGIFSLTGTVYVLYMHVHMKESDLKSLSTIAGILFQHQNKQKDTFLQCVTQTLSSRLLASCCRGCVRTAIVPVPPWGDWGLGKQTE